MALPSAIFASPSLTFFSASVHFFRSSPVRYRVSSASRAAARAAAVVAVPVPAAAVAACVAKVAIKQPHAAASRRMGVFRIMEVEGRVWLIDTQDTTKVSQAKRKARVGDSTHFSPSAK